MQIPWSEIELIAEYVVNSYSYFVVIKYIFSLTRCCVHCGCGMVLMCHLRNTLRSYSCSPHRVGRKLWTAAVHLVESVEDCGLRKCFAWMLRIAHLQHMWIAMMPALSSKLTQIKLPFLPLACIGYKFYWLDEVNKVYLKVCFAKG